MSGYNRGSVAKPSEVRAFIEHLIRVNVNLVKQGKGDETR